MIVFLIALGLSMDAFSVSLLYGTFSFETKKILKVSLIVGIFHFIMPLIGNYLGYAVLNLIPFKIEIFTFLIFSLIGIDMIVETFKKTDIKIIDNIIETILFSLAVSIDSLITGVSLKYLTSSLLVSYFTFFIVSMVMTYLGFNLGKKINLKYGNLSTLFGGFLLIIIGIIELLR